MDIEKFYRDLETFFADSNMSGAMEYIEGCLKIAEKENDYRAMISICNEYGGLCRAFGLLDRAQCMYNRVLVLMECIGEKKSEDHATVLINLGVVYVAQKKHKMAEAVFIKAEEELLSAGYGKDYRIAALYNDMCMLYRDMGEFKKAEESVNKSLEVILRYPEAKGEWATTLINRGQLQMRANKYDDAEINFLQALDIYEGELCGRDVHYSHVYAGLGELAYRRENLDDALKYYEKALMLVKGNDGMKVSYDLISKNIRKIKDERLRTVKKVL